MSVIEDSKNPGTAQLTLVAASTERYVVNAAVGEITIPENRLRELRDYQGLAESMDKAGLIHPITITESKRLVSGRHRLEAAKHLGWNTIPAFVVEDDELANRLREIDENLSRQDLTVYEQAKHAEERERVLEAMGQRARVGDNQHRGPATVAGPKTTADIAKEAYTTRIAAPRTHICRTFSAVVGYESATVADSYVAAFGARRPPGVGAG